MGRAVSDGLGIPAQLATICRGLPASGGPPGARRRSGVCGDDPTGDYPKVGCRLAFAEGLWSPLTSTPSRRFRDPSSATKSGKSDRSRMVPLSELVHLVVETWTEGREPNDLLFTAPEGGYLSAQGWRHAVHWTKAGLGQRPHDLRHTAASLAISVGANVKAVQRMLGHASAAMTLDIYAGLFADDLDQAGSRLDSLVPQMCHDDGRESSGEEVGEVGNGP